MACDQDIVVPSPVCHYTKYEMRKMLKNFVATLTREKIARIGKLIFLSLWTARHNINILQGGIEYSRILIYKTLEQSR